MIIGNESAITKEYMEKGHSEIHPIINMHGHFGPFIGSSMPAAEIDEMLKVIKRCGIKRIVCSSHQFISSDTDYGNSSVQKVINEYPEIFLGYWGVNPNLEDVTKKDINKFDSLKGFVGFKFLPDYHIYPLNGKKYEPALNFANERGLLLLIHTWGGSKFDSPQLFSEVASKYSNINFIMGHSGYGDWEYSIPLARDLPNVYLDLTSVYIAHDFSQLPYGTGMPTQVPSWVSVNGIIEYMVSVVTSKKILYGDDLPWFAPHFAIGSLLFANIKDEEKCDIMYKNAEILLQNFLNRI